MRFLRGSLVLLALAALVLPLPSQHGHEAWESDLARHDHHGQALMLLGEERCEDSRQHLHAAVVHAHEACSACLGAATRVSVAPPQPIALSGEQDAVARAATSASARSLLAAPILPGRAPPTPA